MERLSLKVEFENWLLSEYVQYSHHYCNFENGLIIDSYKIGNKVRYVNHSRDPNCEIQEWFVGGIARICLFAKFYIKKGEELTFNYKFLRYNINEAPQ